MAIRQEPEAPQIPQWGGGDDGGKEVRLHRHPDGADGAKHKHIALARRKYRLLAPEEPEGNPTATKPQGRGYSPKKTTETGRKDGKTGSTRSLRVASRRTKTRGEYSLNGSARETCAETRGGGRGGTPNQVARTSRARQGDKAGHPNQAAGSHRA